jgi:hypothetical protein
LLVKRGHHHAGIMLRHHHGVIVAGDQKAARSVATYVDKRR